MNDIETRTIEVIARAKELDPKEITPDSSFEDMGIDSLQGINIVFELETEFDVMVPNEEALQIRTVREAVESLEKLIGPETEKRAAS